MRVLVATLWCIVVSIMALTACATAPIPPTYTKEELKAICERHAGWWRPEILDGYCERR
jgi:hypothetical protein